MIVHASLFRHAPLPRSPFGCVRTGIESTKALSREHTEFDFCHVDLAAYLGRPAKREFV